MSYIKLYCNDSYLNFNYIKIVELIGSLQAKHGKKSDLRKGEKYLAEKLGLTKTHIKALYRYNRKVKIPIEVCKILDEIIMYIQSNEKLKEIVHKFCLNIFDDLGKCYCRDILLGKYYNCLSSYNKEFKSIIHNDLYNQLYQYLVKCNYAKK